MALLAAVPDIIRLIQSAANYAVLVEGKKAGRAEAIAEALQIASIELDYASAVREDALRTHASVDDDDAFDREFMRK